MKRILTVVLTVAITITFLTACGKDKKTLKPSGVKSSASKSSSSLDSEDSSLSEDNPSLAEKDTPLTTQASQATTPTANQNTAPKVTTKTQATTVKVQAVITPPTTTQTAKKLIVPTAAQCQVIENEIVRLVNQYRASKGLSAFTVESKLMQAAGIRAEEASRPNCYMHDRPNGDPCGTVLDQVKYGTPYEDISIINGRQVTQTLYDSGAGAENLARISTLSIDQQFYFTCTDAELKKIAKTMFEGWKASSGHNLNMININYTKIGIGVYAKYEITLQNNKDIGFYGIQTFTQR